MTTATAPPPIEGWPPRWGTQRNLNRKTDGPLVTKLAKIMGIKLKPWQNELFAVALEKDGPRYVYSVVGQSIARQQAKTLNLSLRIGLELQRQNARVLYTSTDRSLAVERWSEISDVLMQSGFAPHVEAKRTGIGLEKLVCRNGAMFKPVTPTARAAGRGQSAVSLVVLDEAAQARDFGAIGALLPTQLVVPSSQLWLASNAGESPLEAPVWSHYTELGRAAVEDPNATLAWFEWCAEVLDPEKFDPADTTHWYAAMPMLCAGLIDEASVRALLTSMPRDEFIRECLNVWGSAQGAVVISPTDWQECFRPTVEVDGNDLSMAMDVAPNGESASISAATLYPGSDSIDIDEDDDTSLVAVEVVESRGGTQWLVARMVELAEKYKPRAVFVDAGSPAGGFADQIEAKGVTIERLTGREFAQACQQVYSLIKDHRLCHIDQHPLNEATQGATKRQYGDLWAWNRRTGYNISPLCSVTMAAAGVLVKPKQLTPGVW